MFRIAASTSCTPLGTTKLIDSTEPSLRIATVTIGGVCGRFATSRTVSTAVLSWIFRAQASAYCTSSAFGSVRPQSLTRRAVLSVKPACPHQRLLDLHRVDAHVLETAQHPVAVMDDGKVAHRGDMAAFAADPALQQHLLGLGMDSHQ